MRNGLVAEPDRILPDQRVALVVADACWFTTENLFREAPSDRAETLLLHCLDYRNAWNRGLRRSLRAGLRGATREREGVRRRELMLPPGWMKSYPRLGMRPIANAVKSWKRRHAPDLPLAIVATYPFYRVLRDLLTETVRFIYLNLDDYELYWPDRSESVRAWEDLAVIEADQTFCVSALRTRELRARLPEAASRIDHLPHGAPTISLSAPGDSGVGEAPADLAEIPRPYVGYLGSMEERFDWKLTGKLAKAIPNASFILIGSRDPRLSGEDASHRADCLASPNVHEMGSRRQETISSYIKAFDVCLIPYKVNHPFNNSCCPTKIMDYMATGRPVVSTALPECRLHAGLFAVTEDDESFIAAVSNLLQDGSDDGLGERRLEWARTHTCRDMANRVLDAIQAGRHPLSSPSRP